MGKNTDVDKDARPSLEKAAEVGKFVPNVKKMSRRTFFKVAGSSAAALAAYPVMGAIPGIVEPVHAAQPGTYDSCRIVVFGSDSLRIDYAQALHNHPRTALSSLCLPICAECGGKSSTQPGWASIWSGLPSEVVKAWSNSQAVTAGIVTATGFKEMPFGYHIMEKLMDTYPESDFFPIWITGKGKNIRGTKTESDGTLIKGPHYSVFRKIVEEGHQGVYKGDNDRENQEVYNLARSALLDAQHYDNFLAFIHFGDPDRTGHKTLSMVDYMEKAYEVDSYIKRLISILPRDTNIVYCSDHGFDFLSEGDNRNGHEYSPYGMVAANVSLNNTGSVSQMSIGRLIYKLAGGSPDYTYRAPGKCPYRLFGSDLI